MNQYRRESLPINEVIKLMETYGTLMRIYGNLELINQLKEAKPENPDVALLIAHMKFSGTVLSLETPKLVQTYRTLLQLRSQELCEALQPELDDLERILTQTINEIKD